MKKILLHIIQPDNIGGTRTVISDIKKSYINDKYQLVDLVQKDVCGINPFKACKFICKYRRLINNNNADLIYICGLEYSGFLMTVAAKFSNISKIIVSVHGSEGDKLNQSLIRKFLFNYIIEPLTVRMANTVFTVCKKELENKAIKRGQHNNIYGTIYNQFPNINYETFRQNVFKTEQNISSNKIVVAVVGRVVKDKGHKYVIDAIKKLNNSKYVFVIIGDGDYVDIYKKELVNYISSGNVLLLGIRRDVFQILRDCDIFLFATLHENHSKALLEAVSMRCAIICTNVGGNPEIIDNKISGIIVRPGDANALVQALIELDDITLRKIYCDAAYAAASKKFSTENTIGKLDLLFENLL